MSPAQPPPDETPGGLEWVIHRAYGCGATVTPGGEGPVCEPDWEDRKAASAVRAHLAETLAGAREDVARALAMAMLGAPRAGIYDEVADAALAVIADRLGTGTP